MRVGLVYDSVFLRHETGMHVESPERLEKTIALLEQAQIMPLLTPIIPRPATLNELMMVHQPEHILYLQSLAQGGGGEIDSDTIVSGDSYEAALNAVGGTIEAAQAVIDGNVDSAFALVRPPGHHASYDQSTGFCLLNNVAVTAKYILSKHNFERLTIIDIDVHHGNGTQSAFSTDKRVQVISVHQHPLYPGSGTMDGNSHGGQYENIINIPLPPNCGDNEYLTAFERVIIPAAIRFRPQMILVSAGYDTHWKDDIAAMYVSISGYVKMIGMIKELAAEICGNKLVLALEGGYDLDSLTASIKATLEVLLGNQNIEDPLGPPPHSFKAPDIRPLIESLRQFYGIG